MTRRMRPSFIGIGFQRCGTSWLNQVMFEHPQICKPRSGLHFFTDNYDKGVEWYERALATFDTGTGVVGEFSTPYCYPDVAEMVADRILADYPDVKLIFSIREPIERSRSDYRRLMRNGEIPETDLPYTDAARIYPEILARSHYSPVLQQFYQRFPAENIHVLRYDDIDLQPAAVVRALYSFLGVSPVIVPNSISKRLGESYAMKSPRVERGIRQLQIAGHNLLSVFPPRIRNRARKSGRALVKMIRRSNTDKAGEIVLEADIREQESYDADIQQVMELTGLDLSGWINQ